MKTCKTCKQTFDLSAFYKATTTRDGVGVDCKSCVSVKNRERYERNADLIKSKVKEWAAANRDKVAQGRKKYYESNKDVLQSYGRQHYSLNKEAYIARAAEWQKANPEKNKACRKRYAQNNRDKVCAKAMKRIAAKKKRTPPWADHAAILEFYKEAKRKTEETGLVHEVDHILPLQGRRVSGLHVPANLQVIPESVNRRKSNKFTPG